MVSQTGYPIPLIPAQPAMHRLAGHPVAAGHFSDRRPGHHFHDGVIALLHDTQLHEHGPATPCRELHHDKACPSGRCQASDEANVSTISRSRTFASLICNNFLYGFKAARRAARAANTARTPPLPLARPQGQRRSAGAKVTNLGPV